MENIRLVSVKSVSELPECFKSLVSFQIVNDKIEAVVLTDGAETIRICVGESYSNNLKILKQQPKKEVQKWKVSGKIDDTIPLQPEVFDEEYKAKDRQHELSYKFGDGEFKVEPFIELVDEDKI